MKQQNGSLPWLSFIRLSGEEGESWVEAYGRTRPVVRLCDQAVDVLRRRQHAAGQELLESARAGMETLDPDTAPSVRSVVERWYYGSLGYYFYCVGEFDGADASMSAAHGTVIAALEETRCLIPLAMDCYEFEMHRARIARERQDWRAMHRHGEIAADMRVGRRPLCVLADGTPIGLAHVQAFYRSVPRVSDEDREAVAPICDDGQSRRNAESSLRYVCRIPGFVIPYP